MARPNGCWFQTGCRTPRLWADTTPSQRGPRCGAPAEAVARWSGPRPTIQPGSIEKEWIGRAEQFYNGVLGLPIVARLSELGGMTFFSLGNHHDFAIHGVGSAAPDADWMSSLGLFHVAFKVGDSLDELRAWKERLDANGVKIELQADHTVTCSLHVRDPDGNGVELYVDTSDLWKREPQAVATLQPLDI